MKNTEKKTKRIKKVFSNHSEVLHLWANQSQDEARSANVFFEGASCYSYGHHYELGRLVEYKGKKVALINSTGYSVTTSKHIHSAWYAVENMLRIKIHGFRHGIPSKDIADGLLMEQSRLIDELFNHFNSRSWYSGYKIQKRDEYGETWLFKAINEFNRTAKALGFEKLAVEPPAEFIQLMNSHIEICLEKKAKRDAEYNSPEAVEKREKRRLAELEALKVKNAEDIAKWRSGGQASSFVYSMSPQILRIKDGQVETSRGAKVELAEAKTLLKAVEKGKAKAGEKIGSYKFNRAFQSAGKDMIQIGCHTIELDEARAILSGAVPRLVLIKE